MRYLLLCLIFILNLVSGAESLSYRSAYWDGEKFISYPRQKHGAEMKEIQGDAIFLTCRLLTGYGHGMLDITFPLYCMMKAHDLLDKQITILLDVKPNLINHPTVVKMTQLMRELFHPKDIIILEKNHLVKNLIKSKNPRHNLKNFYNAFPEAYQHIENLKRYGLQDNIIYRDPSAEPNLVKDFVEFIKSVYQVNLPMIKNRVLVTERSWNRKILNQTELVNTLKVNGYSPVVVDFEQLSIKDQITETVQSEYMLGTYGSNLTNAIFLQPEASVVVLWHKYAKYRRSRKYCIIHGAFLSSQVRLIEYDKPFYDMRDQYPETIHVPEYFYKENGMNILRSEMINMDRLLKYPLPSMHEITNVDLYIEPQDIINLLNRVR